MEQKLNTLERLALMHIAAWGRCTIEEIAEKCGCKKDRLYRLLPRLEKEEMLVSFNIWRSIEGKQVTSYYKLYAIHFNYIEHMKRYFIKLVHPDTWEQTWSIGRSLDFPCEFVINTDVYKWDVEGQVLMKNWKPMDTKENIKKEMGAWFRGKRAVGKSIHVPDGCTEEEIVEAKRILAQWHKREMDDLDAKYWIWQK